MVFVVLIIREINSKAEPGNDNIITSTQQPRRRRSNWEQLNIRRPYKTRDTSNRQSLQQQPHSSSVMV